METLSDTPEGLRPIYEAARLHLARLRVVGPDSLLSAMRRATELSARILDVERVGIWLFDEGHGVLVCRDLFRLRSRKHSAGEVLEAVSYPAYFRALEQRREIAVSDTHTHRATRELVLDYLGPLGIRSMLDAPIFRGGRVAGVVCHEHVGAARKWTRQERDYAGTVADMVSIFLEQSDRYEAEETVATLSTRLAEAQQMEALGRLAAGVAHDFQSFLTPVVGRAERILVMTGTPPAAVKEAKGILDAAERMTHLAQQLLEFGRTTKSGELELDVGVAIQAMEETLRAIAGPDVELRVTRNVQRARARIDESFLDQILANLVSNARDAMEERGEIVITVDVTSLEVAGAERRRFVSIAVADSGSGIDEATRARLFEPAFSTKPRGKGHGLGLPIVYRIASSHGGWVDVETAKGKGSMFRVCLPLSGDEGGNGDSTNSGAG